MKLKCTDQRFVYRFVGKDAEKFAKVTADNISKASLRTGELVEQNGKLVEITSNRALLYQVQERVCKNVPFEANGFYVLHRLSCMYVFRGYHSDECVRNMGFGERIPGYFCGC